MTSGHRHNMEVAKTENGSAIPAESFATQAALMAEVVAGQVPAIVDEAVGQDSQETPEMAGAVANSDETSGLESGQLSPIVETPDSYSDIDLGGKAIVIEMEKLHEDTDKPDDDTETPPDDTEKAPSESSDDTFSTPAASEMELSGAKNDKTSTNGEGGTAVIDTAVSKYEEAASKTPNGATTVEGSPVESLTMANSIMSTASSHGTEVEESTYGTVVMVSHYKVTSYHIDADLYVKIKKDDTIVIAKVNSALIAAASSVWRKMIYGSGCGRPKRGKWVIEMLDPEDYAYGLDIIFSLVHYKYHEIAERPNIDELYAIAHIVEKYDCAHLVVPFMQKWVMSLDWHVVMNKSDGENDDDKTLFLTWVLGEGRWFSRMVSQVAYKATVNETGTVLDASGQPWKSQGLPAGIIDLIVATRIKALKQILPVVSGPLQDMLDASPSSTAKFCRANVGEETKEQCQLIASASLMRGLVGAGLMPVPKPEEYTGSVDELAKKLLGLKVAHYKLPGAKPHQDSHHNCGIQHAEAIKAAMAQDVELSGVFIQALKERAKKSGAFTQELFKDLKPMEDRNPSPIPDEDLRSDVVHYKQEEDFDGAVDYYADGNTGVVIKVEHFDG